MVQKKMQDIPVTRVQGTRSTSIEEISVSGCTACKRGDWGKKGMGGKSKKRDLFFFYHHPKKKATMAHRSEAQLSP
jgi:hypothetical protein